MLDRSKNTPLYSQLQNLLLNRIENNVYEINDKIPTEDKLQKQFNISRITVRKAITELEKKGYLEKKPGKGTFVKTNNPGKKVAQNLNKISTWTETMKRSGCEPKTVKVDFSVEIPAAEIQELLKLEPEDKVVRIKRWRTGNNKPYTIMTNYILEYLVPNIEKNGLNTESLYETYEKKYNIRFGKAKEIVEAKKATAEEREFLKIEKDEPVIAVTRISFDPSGNPFEVVKSSTRADLYKYEIELEGR